jgi:DNA-binding response OmpR family regulator
MSAAVIRILVVGSHPPATSAITTRLVLLGWGSQLVDTLREASIALETFKFEVVLSAEHLPDGRGYELTEVVASRKSTLFVCVALSENSLWLPVLDRGASVLGTRAVSGSDLEFEIVKLLSVSAANLTGRALAEVVQSPWKRPLLPGRKPGGVQASARDAAILRTLAQNPSGSRHPKRVPAAK